MSDVANRIKEIVAENLDYNAAEIEMHSQLIEDLGADSLAAVEINMQIEEAFDVEISDEALEKMLTIQDIVDFVTANG